MLFEKFKVKHLIFASSSSVYGDKLSKSSESDNTDQPLQFYAATKKSLMKLWHILFQKSISYLRQQLDFLQFMGHNEA